MLKVNDSKAREESKGWWFMYKCTNDAGVFIFRGKDKLDELERMVYEEDWSDPKGEVKERIFDTLARL